MSDWQLSDVNQRCTDCSFPFTLRPRVCKAPLDNTSAPLETAGYRQSPIGSLPSVNKRRTSVEDDSIRYQASVGPWSFFDGRIALFDSRSAEKIKMERVCLLSHVFKDNLWTWRWSILFKLPETSSCIFKEQGSGNIYEEAIINLNVLLIYCAEIKYTEQWIRSTTKDTQTLMSFVALSIHCFIYLISVK